MKQQSTDSKVGAVPAGNAPRSAVLKKPKPTMDKPANSHTIQAAVMVRSSARAILACNEQRKGGRDV